MPPYQHSFLVVILDAVFVEQLQFDVVDFELPPDLRGLKLKM
jgi:hypothetical protein